jgi:hypothetical protein
VSGSTTTVGRAGRLVALASAPLAVCQACVRHLRHSHHKDRERSQQQRNGMSQRCPNHRRWRFLTAIHPVGLRSIRTMGLFCDPVLVALRCLSNPIPVDLAGAPGQRLSKRLARPLHPGLQSSKSRLQTIHAVNLRLSCFGLVTEIGTANIHGFIAVLMLACRVREHEESNKCPGERCSHFGSWLTSKASDMPRACLWNHAVIA